MLSVLTTGFLWGMAHALDADHLAAVATLTARHSSVRNVLKQGISWGLGHTLTLLVFAVSLFVLGGTVSPSIAPAAEALVGAMLVVLGARLIWRARRERLHIHFHSHPGGTTHLHVHFHSGETERHSASPHRHEHRRRLSAQSFLIGLVHGMAGSAPLLLMLASQFESHWMILSFVALFGAGSIIGMALASQVIALPLRHFRQRGEALFATAQYAIATTSILIGGFYILVGAGFSAA